MKPYTLVPKETHTLCLTLRQRIPVPFNVYITCNETHITSFYGPNIMSYLLPQSPAACEGGRPATPKHSYIRMVTYVC